MRFLSTILLLVFLAGGLSAQVYTGPKWAPGNFDTTVAGNYRGAKITSRAQLDSMKSIYGVHTVLNLAKDALPKSGKSEIEWSEELGMKYVSVYLGNRPPSDKKWEMIKAMLDSGGVYVHCHHGADRTGAILAMYRIEREGYTPQQAYKEARKYGFKPWNTYLREWIGYPKSAEK